MGLENEVEHFLDEVEKIFEETGVPCFLYCLFGCCICAICARVHCSQRRISRIQDLVNDFNANNLEKGIFFDDFNNFDDFWGAFYIRMDVVKRKEFCAKNGITFIMPETLTEMTEIIPHTLRKIWSIKEDYGGGGRNYGSGGRMYGGGGRNYGGGGRNYGGGGRNYGGGGPGDGGGDCGGGGGGGGGDCGGGGE